VCGQTAAVGRPAAVHARGPRLAPP
jgi:hypothetical protein